MFIGAAAHGHTHKELDSCGIPPAPPSVPHCHSTKNMTTCDLIS
jgi:hypothetical protein